MPHAHIHHARAWLFFILFFVSVLRSNGHNKPWPESEPVFRALPFLFLFPGSGPDLQEEENKTTQRCSHIGHAGGCHTFIINQSHPSVHEPTVHQGRSISAAI